MNNLTVQSNLDIMALGNILAESHYFKDAKGAAQAIVKVLAGQELGIGPVAAMTGINIILGKVEISANLLASLVKRSKKYDYKIADLTDNVCKVDFYEDGELTGESSFSIEDGEKAGLLSKDNWKQYPRNMLFSRALSNGVKWFCPDVTAGESIYVPGELPIEIESVIVEEPQLPDEIIKAIQELPKMPVGLVLEHIESRLDDPEDELTYKDELTTRMIRQIVDSERNEVA